MDAAKLAIFVWKIARWLSNKCEIVDERGSGERDRPRRFDQPWREQARPLGTFLGSTHKTLFSEKDETIAWQLEC